MTGDYLKYSIVENGQNTVLETCCGSDSSGKLSANAGVKNSRKGKIVIIIIIMKVDHMKKMVYTQPRTCLKE